MLENLSFDHSLDPWFEEGDLEQLIGATADEVDFPSYFSLALQYSLASIFATSIARDDRLMQLMETKANQLMAKARNIDAQQQTTRKLVTSRFISNRRS